MSRLDSAIRRLVAQRACLDRAASLIAPVEGVVLELGLGNGRTYDHLRTLLPDREIFVLDRQIAAHPDCIPDASHMVLGDFLETLPGLRTHLAGRVALVHCDGGTGDAVRNARLAARIAPLLEPLLAARAVVVSDQALPIAGARPLDLPEPVAPGRYHMYRLP